MAALAVPSSTTPWGLLLALVYLVFLIIRDESLGGDEQLLLEFSNSIEADACKSLADYGPGFNGTTPSTDPNTNKMVWRCGNKVYDRIHPSRQEDSRWTAVDNGRRTHGINLSNTAIYSAKA